MQTELVQLVEAVACHLSRHWFGGLPSQPHDGGFTVPLVHPHQRIVLHEYDHNIDANLRSWLHHEVFLVGRLADDRNAGEFLCTRMFLAGGSRD